MEPYRLGGTIGWGLLEPYRLGAHGASICRGEAPSLNRVKAPLPSLLTISTASSNFVNFTENSSFEMYSLTDWPRGEDKSRIRRQVLSFLGTAPKEEQCRISRKEREMVLQYGPT